MDDIKLFEYKSDYITLEVSITTYNRRKLLRINKVVLNKQGKRYFKGSFQLSLSNAEGLIKLLNEHLPTIQEQAKIPLDLDSNDLCVTTIKPKTRSKKG